MTILLLLSISFTLEAVDFQADTPVLVTSCGQSADVLMVKVLLTKEKIPLVFDKIATVEQLKAAKSLLIVAGGSTKGLGAAKIDQEQEIGRIDALAEFARTNKIPVVVMHIGGKARRGELSDNFNAAAAKYASTLIVVKSGNEDGFFSKIAEEKKIPYFEVEKMIETRDILTKIFIKN
jgi:hypothetical protein